MKHSMLITLFLGAVGCAQVVFSGGSSHMGTIVGIPRIVIGVGDSITLGSNAPPFIVNGWLGLTTVAMGYEQRNFAVGGTNIGDWAQFQHQSTLRTPATGIAASVYGANDVYEVDLQGKGPLDYPNWGRAAMANTLYGAVAYSENIRARDGAWTFGGTWINGASGIPVYEADGDKQTSTAGSTGTVTVSGTTVYLVYLANQPSGDAQFTVSIDGVSQGTFSTLGFGNSTLLENYAYYPQALRFAGLSAGAHSMVVTYSSGTTPLIILWAIGNNLTNHPKFFVGNCLPEQNSANAADVAALNSTLATVLSQLSSDGLAVYAVNSHDAIDPANASLWADIVHPNIAGHAVVATAFEAVMRAHL